MALALFQLGWVCFLQLYFQTFFAMSASSYASAKREFFPQFYLAFEQAA